MTTTHKHEAAPQTTGKLIRWARLYDLFFARKPTQEHKDAVKAAALQPGEKVLDVGCGPGTLAILMAKKVGAEGESVGIDASLEMLDRARSKARKQGSTARFEAVAIEEMSFADDSFDAATSAYMLHHLPMDVQVQGIAEVRRVLKPGGRFVIVDFASQSGSLLGHLMSVLGHRHGSSSFPALEAKLRAAGFSTIERLPSKRKESLIIKAS